MPISNLTAIRIKNSKIIIDAGGPVKNMGPEFDGKYCGWIMADVDRWEPLLNSDPIYKTAAAAKKAMRAIVKDIKARKDIP